MQLTRENYHGLDADRLYMSVHQLKNWHECPARELARQAGEWKQEKTPKAFLVGSYVDCAITTPDEFAAFCEKRYSDLYKKNGEPYAEIQQADAMISRLRGSQEALALLSGKGQHIAVQPVKYLDRKGEEKTVLWKAAMDIVDFNNGIVVDLKTAASLEDGWRTIGTGRKTKNIKVPWYLVHDYNVQLGAYVHVLKQETGKSFTPIILGVTKQLPPDIGAWVFREDDTLEYAFQQFLAKTPTGYQPIMPDGNDAFSPLDGIEAVLEMKAGRIPSPSCGLCEYCRGVKRLMVEDAKCSVG